MSSTPTIEQLFDKIRHLPAHRIAEVDDFVDFLRERRSSTPPAQQKGTLDFPVIHVKDWPQDWNLSREEMYGDDGR